MKSTKNNLLLFLSLIIFSAGIITAQEKEQLDKYPAPIGGIEAILKNVVYPEKAKLEKLQGKVLVKAIIDEKGNVVETSVEKSAGKLLDQAALKAINATKFSPGEKGGKKIKAEVVIPVMFKLQ